MRFVISIVGLVLVFISASAMPQIKEKGWEDYSLKDKLRYYLLEQPFEKGIKAGFGLAFPTDNDDCQYDVEETRTLKVSDKNTCDGKDVFICKALIKCTTKLTNGSKYPFDASAICLASPLCPSNAKDCMTGQTISGMLPGTHYGDSAIQRQGSSNEKEATHPEGATK